ncbi:MAG: pilus assembly protein PilZ [Desulfobacteraceae bacterium 4572_35.2]|nr:MAG: pilus assembly protein PilZ [Desulfobacteraceae bacterium 4572_35.2]
MVDKRRKLRIRKRIRVMYGSEFPSKVGFTSDISESGLCIKSFIVFKPGTVLLLEIEVPSGEIVRLEGRVHWARKVPPNLLRKVKHAGMGVKIINFTNGREVYLDLFH